MYSNKDRIPQDPECFRALGLAMVAFARLEWNAIWCCERLQPGYIETIEPKRKTAGIIANELKLLFSKISDQDLNTKAIPFSDDFIDIVLVRNALLHGKPGTAKDNSQRLFKNGKEWTIDAVNEFSDSCVRISMPLNSLLYDELANGVKIPLNP